MTSTPLIQVLIAAIGGLGAFLLYDLTRYIWRVVIKPHLGRTNRR